MTPTPPLPHSTIPAIRVIMMPRDTNPQGTIFGGVLMSLIDQAAFIEAMRQAPHRYVTVSMETIEFKQPVLVGDVLSLWANTERIGRTSIRVRVDVRASRRGHTDEIDVTSGVATLVAVDERGTPVPVASAWKA